MLVANFTRRDEEIEVKGLWMYDYGQKLQINGLNLPNVFEVHFKWRGLDKAKVVTGITYDGISSVDIPNEALSQNGAITAYLYLSTPEEGKPYPFYSEYSDHETENAGVDKNRIKYRNGSPQWWWLRTPNSGNGNSVRGVDAGGILSGNFASSSYGVAPACNVI